MHLFLAYLLNASQIISSAIHFSKPLLCVTLICGDWSHFHLISPVMPDKAVCCFVYSVTGETTILPLQKQHLVAKNELTFSFRPREKTNKWAGNMLMFHVDVNMKWLGMNDSGSVIKSQLFLLRDFGRYHTPGARHKCFLLVSARCSYHCNVLCHVV